MGGQAIRWHQLWSMPPGDGNKRVVAGKLLKPVKFVSRAERFLVDEPGGLNSSQGARCPTIDDETSVGDEDPFGHGQSLDG